MKMHFLTDKVLATIMSLLALSSASLLNSPNSPQELQKRDCESCGSNLPLARQLGTECGVCPGYGPGDHTCSCNLDAVVSPFLRLPNAIGL